MRSECQSSYSCSGSESGYHDRRGRVTLRRRTNRKARVFDLGRPLFSACVEVADASLSFKAAALLDTVDVLLVDCLSSSELTASSEAIVPHRGELFVNLGETIKRINDVFFFRDNCIRIDANRAALKSEAAEES